MIEKEVETMLRSLGNAKGFLVGLCGELQKALYVIKCFEKGEYEEGCPYELGGELVCPPKQNLRAEHKAKMKKLPKGKRFKFNLPDICTHIGEEGYCFVKYYEWKFNNRHQT